MKKLVTIVSAVMMLLMLAACAPSLNVSAEDAEQIALGNEAIAALEAYAKQEKAKLNKDDQPKGNNLALVAENDGKVTVDTVEYTIKAGSVYTYTENFDKNGNLTSKVYEIDGNVTWGSGDSAEDVKVTFNGTLGKGVVPADGTDIYNFTVNGKGYYPALAEV